MITLMHVYFFVVLATNYQIITGQKRACPPLVPANVSIKEVVGRLYGQEYWFLEPAPDTDCSTFNLLPLENDQCGVPIPRHLYYTYFTDGAFQLYETIILEPQLGVYSQQRAQNLSFPLTTSTILYYQNGNLLVHACREYDSFTRFALFTKCKYITQEQKDQIYRDATTKIPSNYKLYPGTRNNCNVTIL